MWSLTIDCITAMALCVINTDPVPHIKREYPTQVQCERAILLLNANWHPVQGAWKMNCVRRA